MKELSDFIYLMDSVNENHINILKNVNLSDLTRQAFFNFNFKKKYLFCYFNFFF